MASRDSWKPLLLTPFLLVAGCQSEAPSPAGHPDAPATGLTGLSNSVQLVWRPSPVDSVLEEALPRGARAAAADNLPPDAVFKVKPAPIDGRIAGTASPNAGFDVEFNACRTADPEGDRILFSIDADGDGRAEESGTNGGNCRRTFSYTAEVGQVRNLNAVVCVVDLDAAGAPQHTPQCRTYPVEIVGPRAPGASCSVTVGTTTWKATGLPAIPGATCTCTTNGDVINFVPDFSGACVTAGGGTAIWASGGNCSCN